MEQTGPTQVGVQPPATGLATTAPLSSPTDEGTKIEQLKTLATLRDSGALTEAEFEAEKHKILDGR